MVDNLYLTLDKNLYKIVDKTTNYEISPEQIASGTLLASFNQVLNATGTGKTKFDNTETGYILGLDNGVAKFYIGTDTSYFNFDGTNVTIAGVITATSGVIGGFDIGADYIRDAANSFGMASTVSGGDDVRFWAGDTFANRATAPFRITEAGAITASDITITGGSIDGSTITSLSIIADKIAMFSVDTSKLSADKRLIFTSFESIDGWVQVVVGGGAAYLLMSETQVYSGNTLNDLCEMYIDSPDFGSLVYRYPRFQIIARASNLYGEKYLVSHGRPYGATGYVFGFKIVDSTLYAVHWKSGEEYTEEITGITVTHRHVYTAQQFRNEKIEYWVDGVLKKTITTNLSQTESANRYILLVSSKHLGGASGSGIFVYQALFQEDLV